MSEYYIYGLHAIQAVLSKRPEAVKVLYVADGRQDKRVAEIMHNAGRWGITVERLNNQSLHKKFGDVVHQGLIAWVTPPRDYSERDLPALLNAYPSPHFILILDGVTDPHNLGACLRSADAAGVNFVIIPKDNSASLTAVTCKVASGASETVPLVRVTNLVRAIEIIKQAGVWVFGAAGEASTSVYTIEGKASLAIVMGAEGTGLRRLTREHCDGLFSLPMQGSVTSLNVAVASGIALYEVVRQRLTN